jgi:hypothetical protein
MVEDILQWIKLLTASERRQLLKFLKSDFFNSSDKVVTLYQLLRDHLKYNRPWDEQAVADKIYNEKPVDPMNNQESDEAPPKGGNKINANTQEVSPNVQKLRKHLSKLKQLIPQFVAHYALKNDDAIRLPVLITELSKRPDKELFEQACSDYEKVLDTSILDADNYGNLAWLHRERHHYQTAERYAPNLPNLMTTNDYLDRHYLALKLRHITESLIRKNFFQEEKNIERTDIVLQLAEHYYSKDLLIRAYMDIIGFLREVPNEKRFQDFQAAFFEYYPKFSLKEKQTIIKVITHLYNRGLKYKEADWNVDILYWLHNAIRDEELAKSLLLINGVISDDVFLNIVCTISIELGKKLDKEALNQDLLFLNGFIEKYENHLEQEKRAKILQLAKAFKCFHLERYEEAHYLLKGYKEEEDHEQKHVSNQIGENKYDILVRKKYKYAIRARGLLIRIYLIKYLEDFSFPEKFVHEKNAFEKYLAREDVLTNDEKIAYGNFVKILNKIFSLKRKLSYSKNERLHLKKKVQSMDSLFAKDWLIKILNKP